MRLQHGDVPIQFIVVTSVSYLSCPFRSTTHFPSWIVTNTTYRSSDFMIGRCVGNKLLSDTGMVSLRTLFQALGGFLMQSLIFHFSFFCSRCDKSDGHRERGNDVSSIDDTASFFCCFLFLLRRSTRKFVLKLCHASQHDTFWFSSVHWMHNTTLGTLDTSV